MQHQDKQLLAAILATAVDAIIVIDSHGTIRVVNEATEKMFGYTKSEMERQNVKMLMPQPDRGQHDGYLRNYLETGHAKIIGIGRETTGLRKDGSTFPIHLSVSEVNSNEGRWFAGIIHDITDSKRVQDELAALNHQLEERVREQTEELRAAQADLVRSEKLATLGQVAGGIAHEIRNPLSVVRTSIFFLRRAKDVSEKKVEEHLERIERQVAMIDGVVTALTDVARMPEAKISPCAIHAVIDEVARSVSMPANITVDIQLDEDLPPVNIDPLQVAIVFRNLLRNARDAMIDGGIVKVSAVTHRDGVSVLVEDSGPGIAAEDLNKILEPLYSTKARGMGLGLAICVAILEKNLGRLTVESELGKGTTFSVHLPFVANLEAPT